MIGIIGAMDEEVNTLKSLVEDKEVIEHGGFLFVKGKLEGKDVSIVRCGIGKVSAAACTQVLIDYFKPDYIVNTGIAGSLDSKIDIGDIVLSENAVQYDMDVTGFGYKKGEVPRIGTVDFKASSYLLDLAYEENKKVNPDINTFKGRICTGDRFIDDNESKMRIKEEFDGLCCEMEGASIAQVSYINKVPFLIVRAISDKADDEADMDYTEFEQKAIKHCVRLTRALVGSV